MRADRYFASRFGSRNKARVALKEGRVLKNDRPLSPADEVTGEEIFTFLECEDFASLGGRKLRAGLMAFGEEVKGKVYADLGASTGGFTDCLLKEGARRVYAVDVGESQLAPQLAADARVVVLDRTNARYLTAASFPEKIDGVTSDLSFISLRLVLPAIHDILPSGGHALVLFKPQFECGKEGVGKSGILPPARHPALLASFYDFAAELGMAPLAGVHAPIVPKKNIECVLLLEKGGVPAEKGAFLLSLGNFA